MNRYMSRTACTCVLILASRAEAYPVDLNVEVLSPAAPITSADVVTFRALTAEEVFPNTGFTMSSSIDIDGFNIEWDIRTICCPLPGYQVLTRMGSHTEIGPFAPGTYQLTAQWINEDVWGFPLPFWPSEGTGSLTFVVVPEPSPPVGDYNRNGVVDAADYILWRENPDAFGGDQGYADWRANFGSSGDSSSLVGASFASPEPASSALLLAALLHVGLIWIRPPVARQATA